MSILSNSDYSHHIQNLVNHLWNSAHSYVNANWRPEQSFNDLVTQLMDMSPEDRCYLHSDGKVQLKTIMDENRCEIKIPINLRDMIDNSQVSIIGSADNVFASYQAIRNILLMTVWLDLQLNPSQPAMILDPNNKPLKDIQTKYNLSICVVPKQCPKAEPNVISIYLRSSRGQIEKLQQGIVALKEFIETNKYGNFFPTLQTKIDVPINRPEIIGKTCNVLDAIGQRTVTSITTQKSPQTGIANVNIAGKCFASMRLAYNDISERFIIELHFEITTFDSQYLDPREMERLGEEYQVHILMRPSNQSNHRTMIIRGNDKEAQKLFDARKRIVQIIKSQIRY